MNNESKPPEPEFIDHQEIEQNIGLLDRTTSWFWWNTVGMSILLFVALVALCVPHSPESDAPVIVGGLLVVMLISNAYTLHRQHQFKLFRKRLEIGRASCRERVWIAV